MNADGKPLWHGRFGEGPGEAQTGGAVVARVCTGEGAPEVGAA